MNDNSKKIKRTAVSIITVILLIVILISVGVVLYSNKLLPEGLHEYLRSVIEKDEQGTNTSENPVKETPFYEVKYELELSKYDEIEILELANENSLKYEGFSQGTVKEISIIKADGKYGLISNQTGRILIEPQYDKFIKDVYPDKKFAPELETIYGVKDNSYDIINLLTYTVKKNVDQPSHTGTYTYYYDSKQDIIWEQTDNGIIDYSPNENIIENYKNIDTKYSICIAKNKNDTSDISKPTYGYFDLETGKILIKPEFEKASLFQYGVAGVVKDGKGYFISENNVRISDEIFEDVKGIHDYRGWIKQDGVWKLAEFPKIEERNKFITKKEEKNNTTNATNEITNKTNTINTNTTSNTVNDTKNTSN